MMMGENVEGLSKTSFPTCGAYKVPISSAVLTSI